MTSSAGRSMASVARAIAAAVLRPSGSSRRADVGQLVADEALVAPVGDDRDVVGQRAQPRGRRLEQGLGRRAAAGRASGVRAGSAGGAGSRRRRP